jgi:hypothetical protein
MTTAAEIKAAIKAVLDGTGVVGNVYATALYITDVRTLESAIKSNGYAHWAFISRSASATIDEDDEPDGHLYGTLYAETYTVNMLRGYHYNEMEGRQPSETEMDAQWDAVRAAFDTDAAREAFTAIGCAIATPTNAVFGTVDYNAQGVLYSQCRFEIPVRSQP